MEVTKNTFVMFPSSVWGLGRSFGSEPPAGKEAIVSFVGYHESSVYITSGFVVAEGNHGSVVAGDHESIVTGGHGSAGGHC